MSFCLRIKILVHLQPSSLIPALQIKPLLLRIAIQYRLGFKSADVLAFQRNEITKYLITFNLFRDMIQHLNRGCARKIGGILGGRLGLRMLQMSVFVFN